MIRNTQGRFWDAAGIKRAAKAGADRQAGKRFCGYTPRLPASCHGMAEAAAGRGVIYTDADGRQVKCQAWSPAPGVRTYWYVVVDPAFAGEMRLVTLDSGGKVVSIDSTVYNAAGKRAHCQDGSECTRGRYAYGPPKFNRLGCQGCNVVAARQLAGGPVKIVIAGDPSYGRTVRWGTLREVRDGVAVFDGLHDCSGVYDGPNHDGNGVEIKVCDLLELEAGR
jgi:hypothetical protein